MSGRRTAWVISEPQRVLVKGYNVATLLREAGMRPVYLGTVKAWALDAHRLPDVVAWLEYRNVTVTVTEREAA